MSKQNHINLFCALTANKALEELFIYFHFSEDDDDDLQMCVKKMMLRNISLVNFTILNWSNRDLQVAINIQTQLN